MFTLLIFILIIAILILLFTRYFRFKIIFNTDRADSALSLSWLRQFFRALVTFENSKPMLTLYISNKKILKKKLALGKGSHHGIDFMRSIVSKDIRINAYYGFRDPFLTGIACGAFGSASQFINIDSINLEPDFAPEKDYIYLDANAKVNLGSTLIHYFNRIRK